ncbi:2-oxoglutarate dehydrogenase E1 subunit family protein, partial [Mycobacteroides abscessus]
MNGSNPQFGQNEWLVEEMYRRFKEDPSSVDSSWHEFLSDFGAESVAEPATASANGHAAPAPAPTPAAPAPAPAPAAAPAPAPAVKP